MEYEVSVLKINEARPDKFYIRTKNMNEKFLSLDKDIQNCYKNPSFQPSNEKLTPSSLMIVKISGLYYRGKFISIESNLVKIFLVDYGYEETVHASECIGIDSQFAEVPALCIPCHLQVIPFDGNWSEKSIAFFQEKIRNNRPLNVEFRIDLKIPQNSAAIEVFWKDHIVEHAFDLGREIMVYISQEMIKNKHAKFMDVEIEDIDPEINGALSSLNQTDTALDSDVSTEDESTLRTPVDHWPKAHITTKPVSKWTEVCITHVDDVGQIYYQLKSDRKRFRTIREFLHKTFDKSWVKKETIAPQSEETNVDWQPNQACIVLDRKDGHWYRATVVETVSSLEYRVFCVDTGITLQRVNKKRFRVPYHFHDMPGLSQRVILDGVIPIGSTGDPNDWTNLVLNCLYESLSWSYTFNDNRLVFVKYTSDIIEDLPTKAKLILKNQCHQETCVNSTSREHCSKHPATDMSKRLLILEQAQKGTINVERFRKLYGAHSGGRTENMDY